MRRARLAAVLGTSLVGATVLAGASCRKGTGPEIDAAVGPRDARGSGDVDPGDVGPGDADPGDAGPGAPHDASRADSGPGADAMADALLR